MNVRFFSLLVLVPGIAGAAIVSVGDSLSDVRRALEAPNGQLRVGDRQVLYFERGEVELRAGLVTRVNLLSPEEFAAAQVKQAATAERRRQEETARREMLVTEGTALRARKLADADFLAAPLLVQAAFWQNFSRHYPDVSCRDVLVEVESRLTEQMDRLRAQADQAERLAELERRVADAEARAQETQDSDYNNRYYSSYGYGSRQYASYGYDRPRAHFSDAEDCRRHDGVRNQPSVSHTDLGPGFPLPARNVVDVSVHLANIRVCSPVTNTSGNSQTNGQSTTRGARRY